MQTNILLEFIMYGHLEKGKKGIIKNSILLEEKVSSLISLIGILQILKEYKYIS